MTDNPQRDRDRQLAAAQAMAQELLKILRHQAAAEIQRHSEIIASLHRNKQG